AHRRRRDRVPGWRGWHRRADPAHAVRDRLRPEAQPPAVARALVPRRGDARYALTLPVRHRRSQRCVATRRRTARSTLSERPATAREIWPNECNAVLSWPE